MQELYADPVEVEVVDAFTEEYDRLTKVFINCFSTVYQSNLKWPEKRLAEAKISAEYRSSLRKLASDMGFDRRDERLPFYVRHGLHEAFEE